MRVYGEKELRNFGFWSGAKDRVQYLTYDELDIIEQNLIDLYPEGMSETEINDFFWFDEDFIAEILGYNSFDEIMQRSDKI